MVSIEGVDYSAVGQLGIPPAALKAAGKRFVCRYITRDDDWRSLSVEEVRILTAAGIEIVANHEGVADRFLAGYEAGVADAHYAQGHLVRVGLPPTQPIYFSCDFDATPAQQIAIDAYLRGCASVIGLERVGVYGGYWVVKRCFENGTARWFWQTYAWSGNDPDPWKRLIHPETHIYQYDNYGNTIAGTDVDYDRALKPHYGQASDFLTPAYAEPIPPDLKKGQPFPHIDGNGIVWLELTPRRWKALAQTPRKQRASDDAAEVGKPIEQGERVTFLYSVHMPDGSVWFVSKAGSRCRADAFVPEAA